MDASEEFKYWYERFFLQSPSLCALKYDDEKMWEAWKAGYKLGLTEDERLELIKECEALKHDLDGYMQANKEMLNKEWQGLTDDEVIDLIDIDCPPNKAICGSTKGIIKLAKAIEQKLKEKNHGTT